MKTLGDSAFSGCTSLAYAKILSGVTYLGSSLFSSCALTSITIPGTASNIPDSCFSNCSKLSSVTIEYGPTSIGSGAFRSCTSLKSITIPDSVTSIGEYAFRECTALTNVNLSKEITKFGYHSFGYCPQLREVIIPPYVTDISFAFVDCDNLSAAKFLGDAPAIGMASFDSCADNFTIYYLSGSYGWTTPTWNGYRTCAVSSFPDRAGPPSFDVKGVVGGRTVTFNCNMPGATIYYTTENRSTLKLTDPHVNPGDTVLFTAYYGTIYARAYYNGKWSNVAKLILKIPTVNKPTVTKVSAGKYKINTKTPSALIYYTIDGSTPSVTNYYKKFWSSSNGTTVSIPSGKTVKVIAVRNCFSNSEVVTVKT